MAVVTRQRSNWRCTPPLKPVTAGPAAWCAHAIHVHTKAQLGPSKGGGPLPSRPPSSRPSLPHSRPLSRPRKRTRKTSTKALVFKVPVTSFPVIADPTPALPLRSATPLTPASPASPSHLPAGPSLPASLSHARKTELRRSYTLYGDWEQSTCAIRARLLLTSPYI